MRTQPADLTGDDLTHSLSGRERDHTFLACDGRPFEDISPLTGLDDIGDGRVLATLDFDHDGWPDLATVSHTSPFLQLFRNQMFKVQKGQVTALRLIGGNTSSTPSSEWSNRDAIGARLSYTLGSQTLIRHLKGQEGLATMPSRTLLLGLGSQSQLQELLVQWPSGKSTAIGSLEAGQVTTVYENPQVSPNGLSHLTQDYRPARIQAQEAASVTWSPEATRADSPKVKLIFLVATWCAKCKSELPHLSKLREHFSQEELGLYSCGFDPSESQATLQAYWSDHSPAAQLIETNHQERRSLESLITKYFGQFGPSVSVLTDQNGRILSLHQGLPTLSEVKKKLHHPKPDPKVKQRLIHSCEAWNSDRSWPLYLD